MYFFNFITVITVEWLDADIYYWNQNCQLSLSFPKLLMTEVQIPDVTLHYFFHVLLFS